jgi:hypothetical protein
MSVSVSVTVSTEEHPLIAAKLGTIRQVPRHGGVTIGSKVFGGPLQATFGCPTRYSPRWGSVWCEVLRTRQAGRRAPLATSRIVRCANGDLIQPTMALAIKSSRGRPRQPAGCTLFG